MAGDFNAPLRVSKKIGENPLDIGSIEDLHSFLSKANLIDLDLFDCKYAWTNCRFDKDLIMSKLDRVLASE